MTNTVPQVSLRSFNYTKACKPTTGVGVLSASTEYLDFIGGGFPAELDVVSHVTGEIVRFRQVSYEDPWCDPDGWDGELMVYRPVKACKNVGKLVLSHF